MTAYSDEFEQTIVGGRELRAYVSFAEHLDHDHPSDSVVGYVVRKTISPYGSVLWHTEVDASGDEVRECGYDVAVVEGARNYADTFPIRDLHRRGKGYAVVDTLYACGCRSTLNLATRLIATDQVAQAEGGQLS